MNGDWRALLVAARRRLDMLEDDLRDLHAELDQGVESPDVPVRVQRPFDTLLLRYVAATDQATDALLVAACIGRKRSRDEMVRRVSKRLSGELARDIADWFHDPVRADAEDIRNLSTHQSYEKRLVGDKWHVQPPRGAQAVEPRDLASYADAVAKHARRLGALLPRLEAELARISTEDEE